MFATSCTRSLAITVPRVRASATLAPCTLLVCTGDSRERRGDPQIVVGLQIDRSGFPLEIGCFESNAAETTTLVPIVTFPTWRGY